VGKIGRFCLNWKVLGSLALAGLVIWAVAPKLVVGAVPVLAVLACPLSMMLMMRGMHGNMAAQRETGAGQSNEPASHDERIAGLERRLEQADAERAAVVREIGALKAEQGSPERVALPSPSGTNGNG
jgi:hypothetical protein